MGLMPDAGAARMLSPQRRRRQRRVWRRVPAKSKGTPQHRGRSRGLDSGSSSASLRAVVLDEADLSASLAAPIALM